MRKCVLIIIAIISLIGLSAWVAWSVKQQRITPAANDTWLDQVNITTDNPQQAGKNLAR